MAVEQLAYRSDLLGVPVRTAPSSPPLGRTHELLFSDSEGHLIGILLDHGSTWRDSLVYPAEEIELIGYSAVLVRNPQAILRSRRQDLLRDLIQRQSLPLGRTLYDEHGEYVGRIEDLAFSLSTRKILGYSLSRGLILDLIEGRAFLPLAEWARLGRGQVSPIQDLDHPGMSKSADGGKKEGETR